MNVTVHRNVHSLQCTVTCINKIKTASQFGIEWGLNEFRHLGGHNIRIWNIFRTIALYGVNQGLSVSSINFEAHWSNGNNDFLCTATQGWVSTEWLKRLAKELKWLWLNVSLSHMTVLTSNLSFAVDSHFAVWCLEMRSNAVKGDKIKSNEEIAVKWVEIGKIPPN